MKQVQLLIQQALQEGTLHQKNWQLQPVPPVLLEQSSVVAAPAKNVASGGYYGPSTSSSSSSEATVQAASFQSKGDNNAGYYGPSSLSSSLLPANDNVYYGPSSSTTTTSTSPPHKKLKTHHSFSNKNKSKSSNDDNYYGPRSTTNAIEEDFVALPSRKKKTNKNRSNKYVRKDSAGFNQSSKALHNRAKRFSGPGGIVDASSSATTVVAGIDRYMGKSMIGGVKELSEEDYEHMTVKGKNQTLEKDYLRLTAPPRPELVRPLPVLEQHLKNLQAERAREDDRREYLWFCSQLKAIRQDLTVQRIQNAFSVRVYETHARIALEEGDLNEYNQCQTQLKELYRVLSDDEVALANRIEFRAYRLIYYIFLTGNEKYSGGSSDLFQLMLSLSTKERETVAIRHALQVREAVADVDYHRFFCLRDNCPNLGAYLMDYIVPTIRHKALLRICKAYRPSVRVEFVLKELGFETEKASDLEFGRTWLLSCSCVLMEDGKVINTKESSVTESDMETKKSLI